MAGLGLADRSHHVLGGGYDVERSRVDDRDARREVDDDVVEVAVVVEASREARIDRARIRHGQEADDEPEEDPDGQTPQHEGTIARGHHACNRCHHDLLHGRRSPSVTCLTVGRSAAFQPPPRAWTSSTAAAMRRPRIWIAVASLVSAAVWAMITMR